ncbi:hypothetical protein KY329_03990 [Candidatus Woesearchaeota archaeon]|nr:hypothetical protein [Candidatus Woesearchaeota archaeon]
MRRVQLPALANSSLERILRNSKNLAVLDDILTDLQSIQDSELTTGALHPRRIKRKEFLDLQNYALTKGMNTIYLDDKEYKLSGLAGFLLENNISPVRFSTIVGAGAFLTVAALGVLLGLDISPRLQTALDYGGFGGVVGLLVGTLTGLQMTRIGESNDYIYHGRSLFRNTDENLARFSKTWMLEELAYASARQELMNSTKYKVTKEFQNVWGLKETQTEIIYPIKADNYSMLRQGFPQAIALKVANQWAAENPTEVGTKWLQQKVEEELGEAKDWIDNGKATSASAKGTALFMIYEKVLGPDVYKRILRSPAPVHEDFVEKIEQYT